MWDFFNLLSKIFPCWVQTGKLVIRKSGEYPVDLDWTPADVIIDPDCGAGVGVCLGDLDGFDRVIVPGGFVLEATLNSEKRVVRWLASK